MSNNSDPMFEQYSNMDFSDAKYISEIPHLVKLQADHGGKSRISILLDNTTLAVFKAQAEIMGSNYQVLINDALRQFAKSQQTTLPDTR